MLRTRSGHEPTSDPPPVDSVALESELGEVIATARTEMARLVQLGELQSDPLRYPIQALSVHLDALHRLFTASTLTLGRQIETARTPISDEDMRRLTASAASELPRAVERLVLQRFRMMVVAVAGILVLTLVVGAGGGYWLGYRHEAERTLAAQAGLPVVLTGEGAAQWLNLMRLNDITRSSKTCSPQNGREACSIALWTQPPASPQ